MLLKVGELARRTGLTVRALHHYDSIGLLKPAGRTDRGYRLYSDGDVARLHGIQALRGMGVPLAEVAQLLQADAATLPAVLARQISTLDEQIALARSLRDRVGVMQVLLAARGQREIDGWLASFATMSTFEAYFSVHELKLVFERWGRCASEWPPLLQAIREAMERGVPPDSLAVQPLARRWLDVAARWTDGDVALLRRWGIMLRERQDLPLPTGMDRELLDYIDQAVHCRLAALARHIGLDGLQRLDKTLDPQWQLLGERAQRLMADGVSPQSAHARELARDFQTLLDRMVRHDAALRARLVAAYESEPLLQAGAPLTPQARDYLRQAAEP